MKVAAVLIVATCLIDLVLLYLIGWLLLSEPPHRYVESYQWTPLLHSSITFFIDGVSLSMVIATLILFLTIAIFSVDYMYGKRRLAEYYFLLNLLLIGLVGVFITSNLMLFYFFWELMLIPSYFIIGEWGYRNSYSVALKFLIFMHIGAVLILLGIGATFMVTEDLDIFNVQKALMNASPELVKWILLVLTVGFAIKMAIIPDVRSEAPAPMSALLDSIIISVGTYAMLRITLMTVFPLVATTFFGSQFLHFLSALAAALAIFGSSIALFEDDINNDSFYVAPVILTLIATVLSLAYSLRYINSIFFGQTNIEHAMDAPPLMAAAMLILAFLVIFLGLWPDLFLRLLTTVNFSI